LFSCHDVQVLQQEGWHYELEKKEEPLTYKGVVYNEMKGVYSSPDQIMGRVTQNVRPLLLILPPRLQEKLCAHHF
jgi:Zn-dependent M16 (insulinase) family peptidase